MRWLARGSTLGRSGFIDGASRHFAARANTEVGKVARLFAMRTERARSTLSLSGEGRNGGSRGVLFCVAADKLVFLQEAVNDVLRGEVGFVG